MANLPVCSLRQTYAFLQDPAAYMVGPGLRMGDVYRVRRPGKALYVVTAPGLAEQILVGQAAAFEKSRVYWRELRRSLGESLGTLEGERWEYLHEAQRAFFTPDAIRSRMDAVEKQARDHFRAFHGEGGAGAQVALLDSFAVLNARIVLAVLFGQDGDPAAPEVARRIADGHAIVAWRDRFPWRPLLARLNGTNRRARRHKAWLGEYVDRLRRSASAADPRYLLHALTRLGADPKTPAVEGSLLHSEVTFHLGAGTETTATATGWTVYLLARHPEVLRTLRDEVSRTAGPDVVSARHVDELTYTRQVIQESLRLYPPVYAVLRDCVRASDLGVCAARPGETFLVSICGLHRNPRFWDDPDRFLPDRFAPARAAAISRYQYLPFGAGRHVCIGRHLALSVLTLTVAQLVQQFDCVFPEGDVVPASASSLKPSGPFTARLVPRPGAPVA